MLIFERLLGYGLSKYRNLRFLTFPWPLWPCRQKCSTPNSPKFIVEMSNNNYMRKKALLSSKYGSCSYSWTITFIKPYWKHWKTMKFHWRYTKWYCFCQFYQNTREYYKQTINIAERKKENSSHKKCHMKFTWFIIITACVINNRKLDYI